MNRAKVLRARAEARRFIDRCNTLLDTEVIVGWEPKTGGINGPWQAYEAPAQQGAVRRASMDLTRALAEMRKP